MGTEQRPDERPRVTERQGADGKAASPADVLAQAVSRSGADTSAEADELSRVVKTGGADIDAGRYTTVTTQDDQDRLLDAMIARLRSRSSSEG